MADDDKVFLITGASTGIGVYLRRDSLSMSAQY
jgi:short-subunit dehydrogenase